MRADRLLVLGIDLDPNIIHLVAHLRARGINPMVANMRELVTAGSYTFRNGEDDRLITPRRVIHLTDVDAVFWRPIDLLPYISDPAIRSRWIGLMNGLNDWLFDCSRIPVVVNPLGSHKHNRSKPLHESFLQSVGLNVPSSITSSDLEKLQQFVGEGPAVVKSITNTGVRVRRIEASELAALDPPGPVHLQRQVAGLDVRAFVIDEAVVSLGIASSLVDYHELPLASSYLDRVNLPYDLKRRIVCASRVQGLPFTGWDLKLDRDGTYWCLECNPMPSFAPFDRRISGHIVDELIHVLTRRLP